jgi:hypothetical protein
LSPNSGEAGKVTVQALDVVFIQYPLPESTLAVEPVTTSESQFNPPAAGAIVPDVLVMLFTIVPLIIFSYFYALNENPAAPKLLLAVPTPVTSDDTTPELLTKLVIDT